jgi:hypothetical protein
MPARFGRRKTSGHSVVGLNDETADGRKRTNEISRPIRLFPAIRPFVVQSND